MTTPTQAKIDHIAQSFEAAIPFNNLSASDMFYGVNRSVDVHRLAGHWFDASLDFDDGIIRASSKVCMYGHDIDAFIMHPKTIEERCPKAVAFMTPHGRVKIYDTEECPLDRVYGVLLKSWKLYDEYGYCDVLYNLTPSNCNFSTSTMHTASYAVRFGPIPAGTRFCTLPIANINIKITRAPNPTKETDQ